MDKSQLRQELKERLMQLTTKDRIEKSKVICQQIVDSDVFRKASVIMTFLPLPHEVDTTLLILHAWQQGKTVAVPKVSWQQRHMIPVELKSLETGLKTSEKGLRTPINGVPIPFTEINLVITPGLGFDRRGNRLGRGGAFYDNFFAHRNMTADRWAVAFEVQVCTEVPHDEKDMSVDAVVTENELIICSKN